MALLGTIQMDDRLDYYFVYITTQKLKANEQRLISITTLGTCNLIFQSQDNSETQSQLIEEEA